MARESLVQCVLAGIMGSDWENGIHDAALGTITDPHAQSTLARLNLRRDNEIAKSIMPNLDPNSHTGRAMTRFGEMTGIPAHELYQMIASPDAILGRQITDQMERLYLDHLKHFGTNDPDAWHKGYAPIIKEMKNQAMESVPGLYKDYALKYFNNHIKGGQLYARTETGNAISVAARNAVGNIVTWNPLITTLNAFEFLPKAFVYATEVAGPVQAPFKVLEAMLSYVGKTGVNFTRKIPEFDALGIYGIRSERGPAFFGVRNILDLTENPLRGMSAELAQRLGRLPTEGAERVAFINRFGNETQVLWTRSGADSLALMRFSIAANKMYMGLAAKALRGDATAASALLGFSVITAFQTGGASAIPAPVDAILTSVYGDQYKAVASDIDDKFGMNLTKHILGTDLSDKVRPVGGTAFGVGFTVLGQDITSGFSAGLKSIKAASEGEVGLSAARFAESMFGLLQIGRIPGINSTSRRFVKAIADAVDTETSVEQSPEGVVGAFLENSGLLKEPE